MSELITEARRSVGNWHSVAILVKFVSIKHSIEYVLPFPINMVLTHVLIHVSIHAFYWTIVSVESYFKSNILLIIVLR